MTAAFKKLIHIVADFLFPIRCLGCNRDGNLLCPDCETLLTESVTEQTNGRIEAVFPYRFRLVRELIWHLKYRQIAQTAEIFAPYLRDKILSLIADDWWLANYLKTRPIILIPVPMSRKRRRQKNFNQAEVLAQAVANGTDYLLFMPNLVAKTRHTKTQVACQSRTERKQNLQNAFLVTKPEVIRGQVCIVIDDVTTTGATMTEIIKKLKAAGARTVFGLAVAHD
ncbi:MAG: phosphoribosyltransferase family protein [Candidatus Paceibacterota bacterium]